MFQQINLYQEIKKKEVILPVKQVLLINAGFVAILILVSAYMLYDYYKTAVNLQRLQAEQENLDKGLEQVQQQAPTEEDKKKLEKDLKKLEATKEYREQMYRSLSKIQQRDSVELSKYLHAMTKPSMTDLWLTKFHLQNNGSVVTFEGMAINSGSVPKYLQSLGENEIFQNKTFGKLEMFYDEDTTQTKFIVGS
jgi:Tfp pilus assembly protein PilN